MIPNRKEPPGIIAAAEHPVFAQFEPRAAQPVAGFEINFLGQKFNPDFGMTAKVLEYPPAGEESFEWLAVLEAVLEARDTLTIFELGAGFGRWMITAACAARMTNPDLTLKLVGAEPEPTHFRWMRQHFLDNGIDPDQHELIEAAVNATGGKVEFIIGHPKEWYGQAIVPRGWTLANYPTTIACYPTARKVELPAVRFVDVLAAHDSIDLIDLDIQGAELEVIESSIDVMTCKAWRAYVSTHSPQIHERVASAFTDAGWVLREIHGWTGGQEHTCFGPISFIDGIQYWVNPHLQRPS